MGVNIKNRKASYEYEFLMEFTAGIKLTSSEIKSIRDGQVSIAEAYCYFKRIETKSKDGTPRSHAQLWVKNMHIAEYKEASYKNHDPYRERQLLLKKREMNKLSNAMRDKGLTIVIRKMFLKKGYVVVDIALAKGKKRFDKRQSIKEKDIKRDMDRNFKV